MMQWWTATSLVLCFALLSYFLCQDECHLQKRNRFKIDIVFVHNFPPFSDERQQDPSSAFCSASNAPQCAVHDCVMPVGAIKGK
jgi:hypothetical protein